VELELSAAEMVWFSVFIRRAEVRTLRQLDVCQHRALSADGDVSWTILRIDEYSPKSRRSIASLSTQVVCCE
jgi:hypothetical protein